MKTRHTSNATKTASPCADAQSTATLSVNPLDLYALRDTLALAAFAAEAARVLEELDQVCQIYPELDATLHRHIPARHEWRCMDVALPAVLKRAAQQLDDAVGAV